MTTRGHFFCLWRQTVTKLVINLTVSCIFFIHTSHHLILFFQGNDPIVQTFLLCNLSCISYDDMDVYVITCFESIQRPRLKCFSMTCLSHRSCMKNKLRFNVRSIKIKMNVKFWQIFILVSQFLLNIGYYNILCNSIYRKCVTSLGTKNVLVRSYDFSLTLNHLYLQEFDSTIP